MGKADIKQLLYDGLCILSQRAAGAERRHSVNALVQSVYLDLPFGEQFIGREIFFRS